MKNMHSKFVLITTVLLCFLFITFFTVNLYRTKEANPLTDSEFPKEPDTPNSNPTLTTDSLHALELLEKADSALFYKGEILNAYRFSKKAFPIFEEVASRTSDSLLWEKYILCAYIQGYSAEILGKVEQGLTSLNNGIALAEKRFGPAHYLIPFGLTKIGFCHRLLGDLETCHQYLIFALEKFKVTLSEKDIYYLAAHGNAAGSYLALKRYEEALYHYSIVKDLLKKHHPYNYRLKAITLFNIGKIFLRQGRKTQGAPYVREAVATIKKQYGTDYRTIGRFDNLKAQMHFEMEDWPQAIQDYLNTITNLEKNPELDSPILSIAYSDLAFAYGEMGDFERATAYYQKAFQIVSPSEASVAAHSNPSLDDLFLIVRARCLLERKAETLKKYYTASGDIAQLETAYHTYILALQKTDQLLLEYRNEEAKLDLCENTLPLLEGAIETAVDLYEHTGDSDYIFQAFTFAEKGKAFLLAENLRKSKLLPNTDVPSNLIAREDSLQLEIARLRKALSGQKPSGKTMSSDSIRLKLAQTELALDSLRRDLIQQYPRYELLVKHQEELNFYQLQEKLKKENAWLIEYFQGDRNLYIFALFSDEIKYHTVKIDSSFDSFLRQYTLPLDRQKLGQAEESLSDEWWRTGTRLYDQLVAPVIRVDHPTSLIIIPDGLLSYLPFEILATEKQPGGAIPSLLLDEYSIRYEYSANLILNPIKTQQQPEGQFAGFAPTYGQPARITRPDSLYARAIFRNLETEIVPLAHNQPEVEEISRMTGGTMVLAAEATETAFKQMAPQFKILHLALHAATNDLDPNFSSLVFEDYQTGEESTQPQEDGYLHTYEIYNMNLNADLAVLSACNTGAGKIQRGEGVMSLARAFKYAGCDNIVMSLWPVNDVSTKDIMVRFFDHLKNGRGKADALRQAKLDFLRDPANLEQRHPYYWAGFVLIGDNEPIAFGSPWRRYQWLLLFGTVIFFPAAFYLRNRLS